MVKRELRREYSRKRSELNLEDWIQSTSMMLGNFESLQLDGVVHLMSYYPIPERKEFDVAACERLLRLENKALFVYLPRLEEDGVTMQAVLKEDDSQLVLNKYNIAEPAGGELADPQLMDAVFVPLLAFDVKGYRVGYGKGFYDRFLSRCDPDVIKIGFSFFEAVDRIEDINQYDVPLNFCITPGRVYEF